MKLDIQNSQITFSEVEIRDGAVVRVFTAPWKGTLKIHVRECYIKNPTDADYTVGRGVNFPPEAIDSIIEGLLLVKETLKNAENSKSED